MAFGATDRVENTAWRSQARRAEQTQRSADSQPSRFDAMLAKPEAAPPRRADDTRAQDRSATTRQDDRSADTRDTTKGRSSTDDAPRAARPDDGRPVRDRSHAKADSTDDKPAADTDGEPGKAGKAAATTTAIETPAKDEAATATTTPTPVLIPIQPNPTPPPATQTQAAETAGGESAAVANVAAKVPAVPGAVEADDTGAADAPTGGKTAEAKDFLALLGDSGPGAAKADASAATPQGAGGTQGVTQASSASPAAATHAAQAAAPTPPAVPIGQVPMTIGLRSLAGSSEFQIRLDPVELGRIDVKLEIDKAKGTVATHLVVDRPDTLALLQRDAGQLQQALTQAGLDPSAGGVNLSLRGEGGGQANGQSGGQAGGDGRQPGPWQTERSDMPAEAVPVRLLRGYGGLDIRI